MCVFVCVCSLSYALAVGSSVAFQPHTINMSLWRGCGAPGMLTCGRAALTTIDERVSWILVIKIPGGEKLHRRPSDSKTGGPWLAVSFLAQDSYLNVLFVYSEPRQSSQSNYCLLFTVSKISV